MDGQKITGVYRINKGNYAKISIILIDMLLWEAACAKNNNHDYDSYYRYSEPKYVTQNVLAYL